MNEPTGRDERQRRNFARALARFSTIFFKTIRRHDVKLDMLEVRVQSLRDAIDDLRDQQRIVQEQSTVLKTLVDRAQLRAEAAHTLYYDTHDTISGEHVDRDVYHVGGGVFDESTAEYVDPRREQQ